MITSIEQYVEEITPNNKETFGYSLTNVVEHETFNGWAWVGFIRLEGKIVGEVECDGNGGCYSYQFKTPADSADFYDAVKEAYSEREMVDVEEDCFINYLDAVGAR